MASKNIKKENPLISLAVNVIVPYLILTKAAAYLGDKGPTWALLIALSIPLTYGIHDYLKNDRTNYISIFGLINTLFTGGFALLELSSTWFIVKEAAFPFILGAMVLFSSFSKKPVIKFMFNFAQIMDIDKINSKLDQNQSHTKYEKLLINTNNLFALSFFISAFLNFTLAYWVFKDIDPTLTEKARLEALNQQIADMWWMGYVVIALPLTGFLMFILYKLLNGLKELTGLELEDILIQNK
ncbi:MAG: hypothetical protein KDD58_00955 [Bdellovibrionales bacterium]|nr:hypothetical protein [Bdellovibrionales bacterium]